MQGAALYRAGKHDLAVEKLEAALKLRATEVGAKIFLAMAHHRLGHAAQAKKWLAEAAKDVDARKTDTRQVGSDTLAWTRRLELHLWLDEAQSLVDDEK